MAPHTSLRAPLDTATAGGTPAALRAQGDETETSGEDRCKPVLILSRTSINILLNNRITQEALKITHV